LLPAHRTHNRNELLKKETILESLPQSKRLAMPVAAGYPAPYRVGISNLGFHFLWRGLLQSGNCNVERFFADTSPVTLETGSGLATKAALLFSVSYEEDYISLVRILVESGLPPLRTARGGHPLVIAGGPAVSANPFPLAAIADAIALGAGEGTLEAIIGVLANGYGGAAGDTLAKLARIPALYVPGFSGDGVSFNEAAIPDPFPRSIVMTPVSAFPDTLLVESGRGCPGVCAFCLATSIYRPFRSMPVSAFEELLSRLSAPVARVGLVSTAVAANPDFGAIVALLRSRGISVSFSSLRAEDIDGEKARLVGSSGTASVSLAPESGSERLRFALGKKVPDEVYFHAAAMLRAAGVEHFTLYLLTGIPGESEATVVETISFMERFRSAIGGRRFSIHVNPLVPKAWTPLQFYAMPEERSLSAGQARIEQAMRRLGLTVQTKSARVAVRQALFSLGDERIGQAIVNHVEGRLSWRQALAEAGVNGRFPHESKGPDASFPWDGIAGPVRRGTLFKRFEGVS
jgi:radical SAM superfamily enzyme YgiQ (UPF0313 family)